MSRPGHDDGSPYLWMLVGQFAFSIMGTLAHGLSEQVSWQVLGLWRTIVPLLLMSGLALWAGVQLFVTGPRSLWIRSLSGSISLVCTFFAFTRLPVSDVLTITNLFPVWVALLGWPILGRRPTMSTWIAILSGLSGVVLIQQPQFAQGNLASLVALLSSFCSAIAMLGLHHLQRFDSRAIVAHFSGVSMVFCILSIGIFPLTQQGTASVWDWTWIAQSPGLCALLISIGLAASVGQLCLTKAFTLGEPARVSVVGLTQVGFGMLFEITLFQRVYTWQTLLGMVMVLAPTAWLMTHGPNRPQAAEE